ncbi:hypothetical protein ACTFIU_009907 [Dictyostelium citrinum]
MSSYLFYKETITEISILTRKGSDLYCQPYTTGLKYSIKKYQVLSKPIYFKIANNTFEIKCCNHDPFKDVEFKIAEIEYIEPDENSSKYSAKDSFCIVHFTKNPAIYLNFIFCKPIELIDNQKQIKPIDKT